MLSEAAIMRVLLSAPPTSGFPWRRVPGYRVAALRQLIDDSNDLVPNTARGRLSQVVGYFGDRTLVAWPRAPKGGLSGQ